MDDFETVSGWTYVLIGFALGAAVGLLAAPLLRPGAMAGPAEGESEEPSTASKLIKKIPTRVKVATAVGAVKGGGGEAYRIAKKKVGQTLSGEGGKDAESGS